MESINHLIQIGLNVEESVNIMNWSFVVVCKFGKDVFVELCRIAGMESCFSIGVGSKTPTFLECCNYYITRYQKNMTYEELVRVAL